MRNPNRKIPKRKKLKAQGDEKAYLDLEDIDKMEEATVCGRDQLIVRLLFRLGCRVSELMGLTVDDIDFTRGTVRIEHLKAKLQLYCPACGARLGKTHRFCPSCGSRVEEALAREMEKKRMRLLPLDQDSLDMLHEFIEGGPPVYKGERALIFGISSNRARQVVREAADKAGLPHLIDAKTGRLMNISPHRLRDAFAVRAMKTNDSGEGMRQLQEHLGHARFDATAKYRKISGEESKEWYSKLWPEETQAKAEEKKEN
ncbi:MAG: tyrosine-type recombinase/integrase [Dehalococcoidia bacterium]|nr:tyrosine-type recombinase/integrase [Dehalococcoidia bacterium]